MVQLVQQANTLPKIPNEDPQNISQVLRWVFGLLGLEGSKFPDEGERVILADYMKNHLHAYSILDVKNAFTLFVQGKLDYSEKHYQKFSVLFFENVLQSYKRYKVRFTINTYKEPPEPTAEEIETIMREGAISCFVKYCSTGQLWDFNNVNYNYLDKLGMIKHSTERKWRFMEAAKIGLCDEKREMAEKRQLRGKLSHAIEEITKNKNLQITAAKKLALAAYFDDLKESGLELKEILENE